MKISAKLILLPLLLGLFSVQSCNKEEEETEHNHHSCITDTVVIDDCHDPKLIDKGKYAIMANNKLSCQIYQPVCGCDGVTYSSADEATYVYGIKKYTQGPCGQENECFDPKLVSNDPYPMIYDPVCGCDGNTYSNEFEAKNKGIKSFTRGACGQSEENECFDPKLVSNDPIPMIYAPVCGCDGKTYSNEYEARNNGIKSFNKGTCGLDSVIVIEDCYDSNLIDTTTFIPAIYAPVCGCDGKTYSSEMEARYHYGVKDFTVGPCTLIWRKGN